MTTHSDSRPWRERNLANIEEARRVLKEARAGLRPDADAEEGSGEGAPPPDPDNPAPTGSERG